jgi:hypothetical protein
MPFDGTPHRASDALGRLDRVIELLASEDRWCKGVTETPGGRRCVIGAMRAADAQLLEPVVLQAIRDVTGRSYWRIESFNDARATSHALVLAVLERARQDVAAGRLADPPQRTGVRRWLCAAWRPTS